MPTLNTVPFSAQHETTIQSLYAVVNTCDQQTRMRLMRDTMMPIQSVRNIVGSLGQAVGVMGVFATNSWSNTNSALLNLSYISTDPTTLNVIDVINNVVKANIGISSTGLTWTTISIPLSVTPNAHHAYAINVDSGFYSYVSANSPYSIQLRNVYVSMPLNAASFIPITALKSGDVWTSSHYTSVQCNQVVPYRQPLATYGFTSPFSAYSEDLQAHSTWHIIGGMYLYVDSTWATQTLDLKFGFHLGPWYLQYASQGFAVRLNKATGTGGALGEFPASITQSNRAMFTTVRIAVGSFPADNVGTYQLWQFETCWSNPDSVYAKDVIFGALIQPSVGPPAMTSYMVVSGDLMLAQQVNGLYSNLLATGYANQITALGGRPNFSFTAGLGDTLGVQQVNDEWHPHTYGHYRGYLNVGSGSYVALWVMNATSGTSTRIASLQITANGAQWVVMTYGLTNIPSGMPVHGIYLEANSITQAPAAGIVSPFAYD